MSDADDALPSVLVIDDESSNLDTFRRVFRTDFKMRFASSVVKGIALLSGHTFDVALVDYAMPEENGLEFLRRAQQAQPTMCCLLVTAHADLAEVREANARGLAQGVIMKPWDRVAVLRWVQNGKRMASLRRSVGDLRAKMVGK
jgi:DNA-binding NtrC family response regulator